MAGGLDNLSAEGFSQLSRTINEAKELLKQQEVLLRQTLAMEQQIVRHRVAGLREYGDEYSRLLDSIAKAQGSLSAEMFKATEAGKEAADNAERAAESAKQAQNATSGSGGRSVRQTVSNDRVGQMGDADSANWESVGKKRKDILISIEELQIAMDAREKERAKVRTELEKAAYEATLKARMEKEQAAGESAEAETARAGAVTEARLRGIYKVAEAERGYYELINKITSEQEYLKTYDGAAESADYINALENEKALQALQADWDKQRTELIYQEKLRGEGKLDEAAMARVNAEMARRIGGEEEIQERIAELRKKQLEEEEARRRKEEEDEFKKKKDKEKADKKAERLAQKTNVGILIGSGYTFEERKDAWNELIRTKDPETGELGKVDPAKLAGAITSALGSAIKKLEAQIDKIGENKGFIDTRLQGSSLTTYKGSYWDQIQKDIMGVGAINPYFKQETFANKIKELVDSGIAFDLEQRAFLATISDKIANTFNVADATLLRLIRIQQQDSTAGRLGMESALNAFLNNMYENTEYLKTVATSVRSSLEEMQALMDDGAMATEVEYQVQKWMGSLYSVGMSQEAVNKISTALGQIAAGQIEGLTGEGAGNLLIMAANESGLSIADILTEGLDASNTNKLMQAVVNYLAEIAKSSQDNQVVQQQLANVFGVKASDLRAATNLATNDSVSAVFDSVLSYDNMLYRLYEMAGSLKERTSTGEFLSNLWSNITYSLAGSVASSPLAYGTFKAATLLDNVVGGIPIPDITAFGNGVALNTTVADMLRVFSLGTGIVGSIGDLVHGLGNSFSGQKMLEQLGIESGSGLKITPRGDGSLLATGGGVKTTSSSGYVGNASGSDIINSTIQQTKDETEQQVIEAQEESEANQIDILNTTVLKIYELLDDVAHGSGYFRVKVEGYGLTKAGGGGSLGGVGSLDSSSTGPSVASGVSLAGGGVNSGGAGSLNFGGWTTTM